MNVTIWHKLLSLESRDVVSQWFLKLHCNELSARRAKEIIASARQAREFFTSASNASHAVRPLLAFYGVASLSRALALLFRKNGGEEGLTKGHGLETVTWSKSLSGDLNQALVSIGGLRVRSCRGLFSDLIVETQNRMAMHVNSSGVDWRFNYKIPDLGHEIALSDILDRLPDIRDQHAHVKKNAPLVYVDKIGFNSTSGASIKVNADRFKNFESEFSEVGFSISYSGSSAVIAVSARGFEINTPQFLHSYVHKMFGAIPSLHLVSEFGPGVRYSQIAVTYVLSYFLGMFARYYPTHWTALMMGEKGDLLWPSINAAQRYVETAFPELVLEMIEDSIGEM